MHLAVVSANVAQHHDEDIAPLLTALKAEGVAAEVCNWDDESVDWRRFDAAVIRSTWDYTERFQEFLGWIGRCASATRLVNSEALIRWNADKRYLDDLDASGIAVVPTRFFEGSTPIDFTAEGEIVVKPSVSAGSKDTLRFRADQIDAARAHAAAIVATGRTAMVQPYQSAVDDEGETALLYFGGEFSHAIRKGPLLALDAGPTRELFAPEVITSRIATPAQHAIGERVLQVVGPLSGSPTAPVYARVDLLTATDGQQVVLEVELIEPSVFLAVDERAAARFAAVLARL
jgi:O-ureido-D-serine cyclo-ligase